MWIAASWGQLDMVERLMMGFVVYLYQVRDLKENTIMIAGKLSGVAYYHKIFMRCELPTTHVLVRAAKRGLARQQGLAGLNVYEPRKPLTWAQVQRGQDVLPWRSMAGGGVVIWYGLALSFWLLARASELFSKTASSAPIEQYCIRRSDIVFVDDDGEECSMERAGGTHHI